MCVCAYFFMGRLIDGKINARMEGRMNGKMDGLKEGGNWMEGKNDGRTDRYQN